MLKIIRFDFEDGVDIEFVPTKAGYEVWACGVRLETLGREARPSELRARYYHETRARNLPEILGADYSETAQAEARP